MNDSGNMSGKANKSMSSANKFMIPPVLDSKRLEGLRPLRAVTKEEIETYWRDGVVKLEGVLPKEAADYLGDCFEDIFSRDPKVGGKARLVGTEEAMVQAVEKAGQSDRLLGEGGYHNGTKRTGRFLTEANCFRWHTDFHRFCVGSPLPEVIAQLLETNRLKFYADHLFYKEKGSLIRTGMHQDSSFFSLRGEQVAICWVPCDVVTKESGCMCYVRGSHRWTDSAGKNGANRERGTPYLIFQPNNLLTTKANLEVNQPMSKYMPEDMPPLPDIEGNEKDFPVIYHEVKPGDVVVHHVNTIHGAAGNTSTTADRRGASIRYIGDDAVFEPNRAGVGLGGKAYNPMAEGPPKVLGEKELKALNPTGLKDGTPLDGALYPVVYPYEQQSPESRL